MMIPLAEHFHSIQGEGQWVGTPMHFIRLPGCSVGEFPINFTTQFLPTGRSAWRCREGLNGHPFECDTDFSLREKSESSALFQETWEDHICLTGGEPLMHKGIVRHFLDASFSKNKMLHIETSGTIEFNDDAFFQSNVWRTVCPKQGYLKSCIEEANELKLLVGAGFPSNLPDEILTHPNVFLSPINEIGSYMDQSNLERAMELLESHPSWRLSVQLHKYLGVR